MLLLYFSIGNSVIAQSSKCLISLFSKLPLVYTENKGPQCAEKPHRFLPPLVVLGISVWCSWSYWSETLSSPEKSPGTEQQKKHHITWGQTLCVCSAIIFLSETNFGNCKDLFHHSFMQYNFSFGCLSMNKQFGESYPLILKNSVPTLP